MDGGRGSKYFAALALPILIGTMLALVPSPAAAASLGCGSTITSSTRLTANIGPCSADGITIGANNVVLNCAGHTISGTGAPFYAGVLAVAVSDVVITNCRITGFYFDINVCCSSENTLVIGNSVVSSAGYAMFIDGDQDVAVIGNVARGGFGIDIQDTVGSAILHNSATGSMDDGFITNSGSTGNMYVGNAASNNAGYGFYDFSTGTGTSGTGSTYLFNLCAGNSLGGSSPAGLCS